MMNSVFYLNVSNLCHVFLLKKCQLMQNCLFKLSNIGISLRNPLSLMFCLKTKHFRGWDENQHLAQSQMNVS